MLRTTAGWGALMPLYKVSFFDKSGVLTHVESREHQDDISALDLGEHPQSSSVEIWQGKRRVARVQTDQIKARAPRVDLTALESQPLVFDWLVRTTRPETSLARDYLGSLGRRGRLPKRADLAPSEMKPFLSNIGLIDVRLLPTGKDYFIRLAGSKWESVFGAMKGKLLHEFLPAHIEARWRLVFDTVCARSAPVRVTTRISFNDMTWLATEMFVAPLGDNDAVSSLFMCFTSWNRSEA